MEISTQTIVDAIKNFLNCDVKEDNDCLIFEFHLESKIQLIHFPKARIEAICKKLQELHEITDIVLYNNNTYEVLISEETRHAVSILWRTEKIQKEDIENHITYNLSRPSDEYLSYILVKSYGTDFFRRQLGIRIRLRKYFEKFETGLDVFELLRFVLSLITLQIYSETSKSYKEYIKYSNSFLFQLSYNSNIPLIELRYLQDVLGTNRLYYGRRSKIEDIEPPKRLYSIDLTYHYQMAISSESPMLAYISFYHIAEHFFDQVYNDDMIESVQNRITLPGFSTKRKKDIFELIKYINKRLRIRGEENSFNEQEALSLTLKKFINVDDLVNKLTAFDPELLDFYKNNTVKFSAGDTVDFFLVDTDQIFDKLSKRIYKTRNAIVHSKEGEKSKYTPFDDDRILLKEIPLLRFIGEDIIIKNSEVIT